MPQGPGDGEVCEVFGLKPTTPHVVALSFDHFDLHRSSKPAIAFSEDLSVLFMGDYRVAVALNMENGHVGFRKGFEAVDGIVLVQYLFQFL